MFPKMGFQVGRHIPGIIVKYCCQFLASYTLYIHIKHNIQNTGHKKKWCKFKTKKGILELRNSKYNTSMFYKHLAKVNIHHERGKKLTGGPEWCIIHIIRPGNCNNWLTTEKIYHTKLKYNTSSVTSALQKQHQSMWKCATEKNTHWFKSQVILTLIRMHTIQTGSPIYVFTINGSEMCTTFQHKCCISSFIKSTNFKNTQNLHTLKCNLKSLQPYTKLMWWVHKLPFCSNSYDGPHSFCACM